MLKLNHEVIKKSISQNLEFFYMTNPRKNDQPTQMTHQSTHLESNQIKGFMLKWAFYSLSVLKLSLFS